MTEKWKSVIGYEGYYEVSNLGRVKRLTKTISCGRFRIKRKGRVLKTAKYDKSGHLSVNLSKEGVRKNHAVHRLVAKAFIPNPRNLPQVNHINNIKGDNRSVNLEWITLVGNLLHGYKILPAHMRNLYRGEQNLNAKVKANDVRRMRELSKQGISNAELGRVYGLDTSSVWRAVNGDTWKNI